MEKKVTGIIVGDRQDLADLLAAEVAPLVSVARRSRDAADALNMLNRERFDAIFVDVSRAAEAALTLVHRAVQQHSKAAVILYAEGKDPDLILEGFRHGGSDYIDLSNGRKEILPAVRRALGRAGAGSAPVQGKIAALFSVKGGQGVTSLAVNLADRIASIHGGKVLLFDLNLHMGDVGLYLDRASEYTPFDLLKDLERMDENLLFSSIGRNPEGFYILAAPEEISDAEQITGAHLTRMLELLRTHFDHLVLDLPHDFSERTLAALFLADRVFLVAQQGLPEIRSLQSAIELFRELQMENGKAAVILNRYFKDGQIAAGDLEEVLHRPVFGTVANDYRPLNESVSRGKPLAASFPKARITRDIDALAQRIVGGAGESKKRSRWRSKLKALLR